MKKILGSLLIVSILSGTSILSVDVYAYDNHKEHNLVAVVKWVKTEQRNESEIELITEVDSMMAGIDRNIRNINSLLKQKNAILGEIQTKMTLNAYTKTLMSDNQIASFQNFYEDYTVKSGLINATLSEIEQQLVLKETKKEILKENTDYDVMMNELQTISDYQADAIFTLNSIIEFGKRTLAII